jgi:anti-sigma B factor antagonist
MGEAHEDRGTRVARRGSLLIRSERLQDVYVLEPSGEIDLAVTDLLDEEVQRAEAGDAETILLDLGRLEFIDCTGIQTLLRIRERSATDGDRVRIRHVPNHVQRLMRVAGVEEMLPLAA